MDLTHLTQEFLALYGCAVDKKGCFTVTENSHAAHSGGGTEDKIDHAASWHDMNVI